MSTQAAGIIEQVKNTLERHGMIAADEKVLVAVSGGPDSMALLSILRELGHPVEVAHFDHQTRDGVSTEEAAFVRSHAEALEVPFHAESCPVEAEAAESDLSFEEYAREVRYAFLFRTAQARACAAIATGHHADDQAETVLMRFLRGAAPRGLAGIPPVREREGIRIIRPLLDCTRQDIEGYLAERGIESRTDHSNADPCCLRNRIRAELLPQLAREYNPRLTDAVRRMAAILRDENDLLDALAHRLLEGCLQGESALLREPFATFHPALQRRAVLLFAWRQGVDCPHDRVEAAREFICHGPSGKSVDLGGGIMLCNSRTVTEVASGSESEDAAEASLPVPGEMAAFGKRFSVRELDAAPSADLRAYCSPARQVFDADRLDRGLAVRRRRPGDRFSPLGMTGSKKLKDYFIDLGLPASERADQVLVVAGDTIVWVVGRAMAAHAAVTGATTRFLEIEVHDATE